MLNWNDFLIQPWILWLAVALIFAILEMLLPSFAFIFATFGAITAAVASFYLGWLYQTIIFAFGLFTSLVVLRPWLVRHLGKKPRRHFHSRADVLLGRRGVVTEAIDPATNAGRVHVEGEDWAARATSLIPQGANIEVEATDGIVLVVKEV